MTLSGLGDLERDSGLLFAWSGFEFLKQLVGGIGCLSTVVFQRLFLEEK